VGSAQVGVSAGAQQNLPRLSAEFGALSSLNKITGFDGFILTSCSPST
jgi:hypothetical protein